MNEFISLEILDKLSYQSKLGQSLKQISLRNTPITAILDDVGAYRASYIDILLDENIIGSRFKSDDSILRKYEKTLASGGGFKQCFNDVLGFRMKLDEYPTEFPPYFRAVDLRQGKLYDDGYRAVHLYYQRDNLAYPIEIQLWCGRDYHFNMWSHRHAYKYVDRNISKAMFDLYHAGVITTEAEFLTQLKELEGQHGR